MKKPLILLHGAVGSAKQFELLLPFLSNEFELHALNLLGHGGTTIPSEPFSIPLFADFVLNYLKEKNIESASFVGYSMGGYVSLYLAANHSQITKKVFTYGTKIDWNPAFAAGEIKLLNPDKILEKVPAFAESLARIHSDQNWKHVLNKTAEMLLSLGARPHLTDKEFSSIQIPVTISLGELDKMVTKDESERAASITPQGKFLFLENSPHAFEKVNPQLLAGHINQFMME